MNYEVKSNCTKARPSRFSLPMIRNRHGPLQGRRHRRRRREEGTIRDKGIVNNKLSNALMQKLEKEGIPPITLRKSTTVIPSSRR